MRIMAPAASNFTGSPIKPGANSIATSGAPRVTSTVTVSNTDPRAPATRSISPLTAAKDPRSRYSPNTGTNAWAKAPSANRRRRKLGILKATKKASASPSAPTTRAKTTSRTSPNTRDSMVIAPTTALERNRPGRRLSVSDRASVSGREV